MLGDTMYLSCINSVAPGRCGSDFNSEVYLWNSLYRIVASALAVKLFSSEYHRTSLISLVQNQSWYPKYWLPDLVLYQTADKKSTLVQLTALSHQTTIHYLKQEPMLTQIYGDMGKMSGPHWNKLFPVTFKKKKKKSWIQMVIQNTPTIFICSLYYVQPILKNVIKICLSIILLADKLKQINADDHKTFVGEDDKYLHCREGRENYSNMIYHVYSFTVGIWWFSALLT